MSPEEINRAITESVGKEDAHWECLMCGRVEPSHVTHDERHGIEGCLRPVDWIERPNYHGDLNEIRKVVLALPNHQKSRFVVELSRLNTGAETFSFEHRFKCATHDAPDFCTAYLRVVGKWREE